MLRMSETESIPYDKVPFQWTEANTLREASPTPGLGWRRALDDPRFVQLVSDVLASSNDPADAAGVTAVGALEAAQRLIDAPSAWGCSFDPAWWELLTMNDEPAGFIMPATFYASPTTGTIFHMGVAASFRGRGLSGPLLDRVVTTLARSGVAHIYCDTGRDNVPMIRSFESRGWTRLPAITVARHLAFVPIDDA